MDETSRDYQDTMEMTKQADNDTPDNVLHDLVHYQQRHNWDCGLSCVLMVLPTHKRNYIINNFDDVVAEEGFGESTWTIDLCYVLYRFSVRFTYTTITLGVDPGYNRETFYDKVLAKDTDRVDSRFQQAEEKGIVVEKRSVSLDEIVQHLWRHGPVIVLTNANLLSCSLCDTGYPSCYTGGCFGSCVVSYQGHYVVLVGYDGQEVLYRNPTVKDRVCCMTFAALEEARTAYGTDEDVVFVFSDERRAS